MATLVLSTIGTLVGGPLGGAIGALAGRAVDGAVIGGGKREGPRLKELVVTTSSYGQPIARHHGRMRAGGTIIWATDLVEHKQKSGGKKGQPSVTGYAYTTSFAVALSSRPICRVGRIWADGNLLRGAADDLKVAGDVRIHTGHGDQAPDPLIAAALGPECPAFRDCAYVVFEDLALADFGNRIPALSFEIIADENPVHLNEIADGMAPGMAMPELAGYANEGGSLAATLDTIGVLFPLACTSGDKGLVLATDGASDGVLPTLPSPARGGDETDFGCDDGRRDGRSALENEHPDALRYYDIARDFQPGIQRAAGRAGSGRNRTIDFPGALAAADARALAGAAERRSAWRRERISWRTAELDPSLAPGRHVRLQDRAGIWRIESWEWRSRGIELELVRQNPAIAGAAAADAGYLPAPLDAELSGTRLIAFETPPSTFEDQFLAVFAATTGSGRGWAGAALFVDRAGELVPIGASGRERATIGRLAAPLLSSPGMVFEGEAGIDAILDGGSFAPASLAAIAQGANRLLVGDEVLQFSRAEPLPENRWRLSGLLRGRGGTEPAAIRGHPAGTMIVLLDDALIPLDPSAASSGSIATIAAIGAGDSEPIMAGVDNPGLSRRPPCPVHPRLDREAGGGLTLSWTRRARGAWIWSDGLDVPLVEASELYRVGLGPVESPVAEWFATEPRLNLSADIVSTLESARPGTAWWVRQIGTYGQSEPLFLTPLS